MATIIQFQSSCKPCKTPDTKRCVSAEIVIFPGVRYERYNEASTLQAPAKPRRVSKKLTALQTKLD